MKRDEGKSRRSPAEERLSRNISHPPPPRISSLPPEALEEDDEELVRAWGALIDVVDYLALLRLPESGEFGDEELRRAFHGFALAFHPDRWRDSDAGVREAANAVYCRGAEAYKVLQDPLLRRRFLRQRATGKTRLTPEEIAQSARGDAGEDGSIESMVRSPQATPFAKRADELLAKGDPRQAKLQIQLALSKDPGNARLEERLAVISEAIKGATRGA